MEEENSTSSSVEQKKTSNSFSESIDVNFKNKRKSGFAFKKKKCQFCQKDENKNMLKKLNYKNVEVLKYYISDRGRILSSRINGNCNIHQRKVQREIKKARYMALLPYVKVLKINS